MPANISLPLNLHTMIVPAAADHSLVWNDANGLSIVTGDSPFAELAATPLLTSNLTAKINGLEHVAPQTLTLSYMTNLHLVAGEKLNINYDFFGTDTEFNDFSFAVLGDTHNNLQAALLTDARDVLANGSAVQVIGPVNFTGIKVLHRSMHFDVATTGDYTLVLGAADVGDKTSPAQLTVHSVSFGLDANAFTIDSNGIITLTADGTRINLDGTVAPPLALPTISTLGSGSLGLLAGAKLADAGLLPNITQTQLLTTSGGGLIGQDGGGLISQDGGGLAALTKLISQDGGGLKSTNGGALISQDGGGLISQDGGGIVSHDAGGIVSHDAGGLISGTGSFSYSAALGAVPAGTLAAAPVRSYNLASLPDPAALPALGAGTEYVVSPQYDIANNAGIQQVAPAIGGLSNGRYVAAWTTNYGGLGVPGGGNFATSQYAVVAQIMNADGTKQGPELLVSTPDNFQQNQPSVTGLAGGAFVVAWRDRHLEATSNGGSTISSDVKAQFYTAGGSKNGGIVTVNSGVFGPQDQPVVASLWNGGAVVVFRSFNGSNGPTILKGQIYGADGTAQGVNFNLGTNATGSENLPAVAGLHDGGFVVAYENINQGNTVIDQDGIYVQRFNAQGGALGAPFQANIATTGQQTFPAVTTLSDGRYVVSWMFNTTDPSPMLARIFNEDGTPASGEFTVTTNANYGSNPASIVALQGGTFLIVWEDSTTTLANGSVSTAITVRGQQYKADGTPSGSAFTLPSSAGFFQHPAAVTLGDGSLVVLGSLDGYDIRAIPLAVATAPTEAKTFGTLIDGYIKGATVFADANANCVFDAGEAMATTDTYGRFSFTTKPVGAIIATGGVDQSTGVAFTGRLTAPAGSLSVTALSTLVQSIVASGADLGTALAKVSLAFGLSAKTDHGAFDPIATLSNNLSNTTAALVANAVVLNTLKLAASAGATGDLFGKLAASIAAAPGVAMDVTATSTLQTLGLSGTIAGDTARLANASAMLIAQKVIDEGKNSTALLKDVFAIEATTQGDTASALKTSAANGTTGATVGTYTGANLKAVVGANADTQAGTPPKFSFTDATTNTVGYDKGTVYTGPVSFLQQQYIWSSADAVAISAATPNAFLKGGAAGDALQAKGGQNILDGGGGSNFLIGGDGKDGGTDTFYVDGRGGVETWSTIVNFHQGDLATIFGFHPGLSTRPYTANDGAVGYTG